MLLALATSASHSHMLFARRAFSRAAVGHADADNYAFSRMPELTMGYSAEARGTGRLQAMTHLAMIVHPRP